jgi:protein gp37
MPLPNVWLGVTVCNQAEADAKIPVLLQTPAALRFVSIEPMLGPVDLDRWLRVRRAGYRPASGPLIPTDRTSLQDGDMPALDWVICGGETGAGARPMLDWWAMAVMCQCLATSVPFCYKGAGTATMPKRDPCYKLLACREWREFPVATR